MWLFGVKTLERVFDGTAWPPFPSLKRWVRGKLTNIDTEFDEPNAIELGAFVPTNSPCFRSVPGHSIAWAFGRSEITPDFTHCSV
jgi:hypothetical protein